MLDATLTFTLTEWLALTGLVQSVVILVYVTLRVRDWRQASVALVYFFFLAASFALQFALRLEDYADTLRQALWFARAMGAPLSYLLVMQVVRLTDLPEARHFWVLTTAPVFLLGLLIHQSVSELYWLSSMAGALSMLALWSRRDIFTTLRQGKGGRERYWLVIMLVSVNTLGLIVSFFQSSGAIVTADADMLKLVLGIAFAYLATTTLFRVYPAPVQLNAVIRAEMTEEERAISASIRKLMEMDKVYHEPAFSRGAMARELGISEAVLSRVVNATFGKSFPRILNEYRIEDAKRMLADSAIPVQVVAKEVGFNSLASFNRAFKEVTGDSPSGWRARILSS